MTEYKCWAAYDGEHDCDDPTTERSCWWGEDAVEEEIQEHEDDVRRYGLLPRNLEIYHSFEDDATTVKKGS